MKINKIIWGIGFILAAVLIVGSALSIDFLMLGDVTIGSLLAGVTLICLMLYGIVSKKVFLIVAPVSGLFLVFEKYIARAVGIPGGDIISNWIVVLVTVLLCVGIFILFDHKHVNFSGSYNVSSSAQYIDCSDFVNITISNNVAKTDVYFSNTELYQGGGTVEVSNNIGQITVYVPNAWRAVCSASNNIGKFSEDRGGNPNGKTLNIIASSNIGYTCVKYIN